MTSLGVGAAGVKSTVNSMVVSLGWAKVPVPVLVFHFIIVCCGTGMNISEVDTVFPSFVVVSSVGLR